MTPQERQLVDDLFDRLARLEASPRDADAERAIAEGLGRAPHALYPLVQTVLVQDEALRRADARIRELGGDAQNEAAPESFLDSMRSMFGGGRPSRTSVPSVRQGFPAPGSDPRFGGGDPRFANAAPMQNAAPGQGGSSFLGTAAAAAAGYVGGALLMNSIGSMFGGSAHAATPQAAAPLDSGAANSDLARDAGAGNIGDAAHAGDFEDDLDGDFGGDFGGDL